jgi:hypothetical protein
MTRPEWRKRGIFSGLDRAAMDEARRRGWAFAFGLSQPPLGAHFPRAGLDAHRRGAAVDVRAARGRLRGPGAETREGGAGVASCGRTGLAQKRARRGDAIARAPAAARLPRAPPSAFRTSWTRSAQARARLRLHAPAREALPGLALPAGALGPAPGVRRARRRTLRGLLRRATASTRLSGGLPRRRAGRGGRRRSPRRSTLGFASWSAPAPRWSRRRRSTGPGGAGRARGAGFGRRAKRTT